MPSPTLLPPMLWGNDTARARRTDPVTSHEAADSNTHRNEVEAFVLTLFDTIGPMTDEELSTAYELQGGPYTHYESPRKRRSDLTNKGVVAATGEKRLSWSGRRMTVWGIK